MAKICHMASEVLVAPSHYPKQCWLISSHDDVIKWKHFPRYWPFVRGTHRSPVNSPHKGRWRWALMFSVICAWINGQVNDPKAGDLRRHRAHYDVIVMWCLVAFSLRQLHRKCSMHLNLPEPSFKHFTKSYMSLNIWYTENNDIWCHRTRKHYTRG